MLKVSAGGARCPGDSSSRCPSRAEATPCARARGQQSRHGNSGYSIGAWRRQGTLTHREQPCTPCSGVQKLSWPGDLSPLLPPQLVRRIPFLLFTFAQAKKLRTHNYAAHRVWGPSGKGLCQSCTGPVWGSGNLRAEALASRGNRLLPSHPYGLPRSEICTTSAG